MPFRNLQTLAAGTKLRVKNSFFLFAIHLTTYRRENPCHYLLNLPYMVIFSEFHLSACSDTVDVNIICQFCD